MAETITPEGGGNLPLDSLEQTLAYNTDGTVDTITVEYPAGTAFVQTFTWEDGNCTNISQWIPQ